MSRTNVSKRVLQSLFSRLYYTFVILRLLFYSQIHSLILNITEKLIRTTFSISTILVWVNALFLIKIRCLSSKSFKISEGSHENQLQFIPLILWLPAMHKYMLFFLLEFDTHTKMDSNSRRDKQILTSNVFLCTVLFANACNCCQFYIYSRE